MFGLLRRVEDQLQGWPDATLSALLLLAAVVAVVIALRGPSTLKALALAWIIIP